VVLGRQTIIDGIHGERHREADRLVRGLGPQMQTGFIYHYRHDDLGSSGFLTWFWLQLQRLQ